MSPLFVSALTGAGIAELVDAVGNLLAPASTDSEILLTNARHYECLSRCSESLHLASAGLNDGTPLDALALHVRTSLSSLDSILGVTSSDDIINNIFSTFCVGK